MSNLLFSPNLSVDGIIFLMNSEFNSQLDKAYLPSQHEPEVSEIWEKSGAYKPAGDPAKEPFCIIMPPPNANGVLHAGHLMYTVEDIATRFARMQGRPTLWLPGTDHAGIETQYVYEKELAKKACPASISAQKSFTTRLWNLPRGTKKEP